MDPSKKTTSSNSLAAAASNTQQVLATNESSNLSKKPSFSASIKGDPRMSIDPSKAIKLRSDLVSYILAILMQLGL